MTRQKGLFNAALLLLLTAFTSTAMAQMQAESPQAPPPGAQETQQPTAQPAAPPAPSDQMQAQNQPAPAAPAAPAGEMRIPLAGKSKKAGGEAVIKDSGTPGQKDVTIDARGLKKNTTYTVWFANEPPSTDVAPLGTGNHALRTDKDGNGRYAATVAASEVENWQDILVTRHAKKAKNMVKKADLVGKIKK